MQKMKKIITMIIILTLISYCFISLINQKNVLAQTTSPDINGINTSKYPGIKEKIQALQKKYPNWSFKILYTGLDWNDVISNEYVGHGSSPKNLVYNSSNYQGEWVCPVCGNKPYDNGSWRCASEQAIKYMMDPRNSLNESDIFQFEQLTSSGSDLGILQSMTRGTFLAGHEQAIINAANKNNLNCYYVVARLIQEQGKSGTVLALGTGYNGQYVGYYNAFNISATGNTKEAILINALTYAKKKGWTSLDASIEGGISFLGKQYISQGQNTLYLQKFDVIGNNSSNLYNNQYMTNLLAAENEGLTLRNTYINTNSMALPHTFIIPVYENMPQSECSRPNTNASSAITIDLVRVNVDSTLNIRNAPNGSATGASLVKDEIVTRIEKATTKVGGTYWDKVRKSNGTIGYAARETFEGENKYKLYLVPVNENSDNNNNGGNDGKNTTKVKIDKKNNIITVVPSAIANDILDAFGGPTKITRADGSFLNGGNDLMATGFIVEDKYTVVKKGDCNGDGNTNALDAAIILRYNVNQFSLKECYLRAGAISDNNNATALDAAKILRYSVGQYNIEL